MGADRRHFSIDVRWHDDRYHGRGDGGKPEWPPSPLRLMAALVAGGSPLGDAERAALRWLESAQPPTILAPDVQCADGVLSYVPSNNRDAGKA
ncbi:MAG: type I-U CRISPR-associated protein Csb2, partial [Planctomycetota bacterium]